MASKWRFAPFIPASSSRRASRGRRTTPSATRRCDSAPTLRALERFGRLTFPLGQTDRLHDGVAVRALALPEVGLRFVASHMVSLRGSVAVSTSAPRTPPRDLLPLLAGLRESDGNRLLATLHLAAFPALAAPQGAALPSTHRSFDVLARACAVSPSARFLRRHMITPLSPGIRASLTAQHLSSRRYSLACVRHIACQALSEAERGNRQPHARSLRARGLMARTMEILYPVKRSSSSSATCRRPPLNDALSLSSENVRVNCSMKMSALARHAGVRDCAERSRRARRGWAPGVPADVTAECGV